MRAAGLRRIVEALVVLVERDSGLVVGLEVVRDRHIGVAQVGHLAVRLEGLDGRQILLTLIAMLLHAGFQNGGTVVFQNHFARVRRVQ